MNALLSSKFFPNSKSFLSQNFCHSMQLHMPKYSPGVIHSTDLIKTTFINKTEEERVYIIIRNSNLLTVYIIYNTNLIV